MIAFMSRRHVVIVGSLTISSSLAGTGEEVDCRAMLMEEVPSIPMPRFDTYQEPRQRPRRDWEQRERPRKRRRR
jgi:hypothetical protein